MTRLSHKMEQVIKLAQLEATLISLVSYKERIGLCRKSLLSKKHAWHHAIFLSR